MVLDLLCSWSQKNPTRNLTHFSLRSAPDGQISQPRPWRKRSAKPSCSTVLSFSAWLYFSIRSTCFYRWSDEALKIGSRRKTHLHPNKAILSPTSLMSSQRFSHQQNMKNVFILFSNRNAFWVMSRLFQTRRHVRWKLHCKKWRAKLNDDDDDDVSCKHFSVSEKTVWKPEWTGFHFIDEKSVSHIDYFMLWKIMKEQVNFLSDQTCKILKTSYKWIKKLLKSSIFLTQSTDWSLIDHWLIIDWSLIDGFSWNVWTWSEFLKGQTRKCSYKSAFSWFFTLSCSSFIETYGDVVEDCPPAALSLARALVTCLTAPWGTSSGFLSTSWVLFSDQTFVDVFFKSDLYEQPELPVRSAASPWLRHRCCCYGDEHPITLKLADLKISID